MNDMLSAFEDAYAAIVTFNVNRIQNTFRGLEDVANHYLESVQELSSQLSVKAASENPEMSPEAVALLNDKDTLKNAVGLSHDNYINRIVGKSDELQEREDRDVKALIKHIKHTEHDRNRHRVSEIFELVERQRHLIRGKLEEDVEER